jgi:hypothetical protein
MDVYINIINPIITIIGGIYCSLIAFNVIKLKADKPENKEKMILWEKKYIPLFRILGPTLIILGIAMLILFN